MIKIVVTGGRDYRDRWRLEEVLEGINSKEGILLLAHGANPRGADAFAANWARGREIPQRGFAADWRTFGRSAGPMRNEQMLCEVKPDIVVAFSGGRGTADCVRRAKAKGILVREVTG